MGLFLVLEGVEGSGKTTQARRLADRLEACGIDHVLTREPGGTAVGEETRRILLESESVPTRAELLLMLGARAAFVDEVVRPALERGDVVVADRYALSTLAYQGYGRGLPLDQIRSMNAFATVGLNPDLTLVLDVPPAVGERRHRDAGRSADRIERAGASFHRKVGEAYRLLSNTEPGVESLDATGSIAEVHEAIWQRLLERFPETFADAAGYKTGRSNTGTGV